MWPYTQCAKIGCFSVDNQPVVDFALVLPITLGYYCEHEVSDSPYRTDLLLPRLPWKRYQQEEGWAHAKTANAAEGRKGARTNPSAKPLASEARDDLQARQALWYNFRWSLGKRTAQLRTSASCNLPGHKTSKTRRTLRTSTGGRLRLGEIHPNDPWPKPTTVAPPIFRAFAKEFLQVRQDAHEAGNTHVLQRGALRGCWHSLPSQMPRWMRLQAIWRADTHGIGRK